MTKDGAGRAAPGTEGADRPEFVVASSGEVDRWLREHADDPGGPPAALLAAWDAEDWPMVVRQCQKWAQERAEESRRQAEAAKEWAVFVAAAPPEEQDA